MQRVCVCIETVYDEYKMQEVGRSTHSVKDGAQQWQIGSVRVRAGNESSAAERRRRAELKKILLTICI